MRIFDPQLTGSIQFLNPIIGGVSGSLFGTASWATNVVNAGGLSGGQTRYITRWESPTSVTTSSMYEGNNKNIAINATAFDVTNPQALLVSGSTINIISGESNVDSYAQLNIINRSTTGNASSDIVATNDQASEFGNFVDLGINSSNYAGLIGSNNEAYLYNTGSNLLIGNTTRGTDANVKFFAGNDAVIFPLIVSGTQTFVTGSLLGTASFASNAGNALTASFVNDLNQSVRITGSLIVTGALLTNDGIIAQTVTASFTGSLTGQLFGTASYVTGSIFTSNNLVLSSSYALTSSYAFSAGVNSFATISIAGQNSLLADSSTDTLTLAAGTGITLRTNATNDIVSITASVFPFTGSAIVSGNLSVTGGLSVASGTFRLDGGDDPGNTKTDSVFLFASRSEDGSSTDFYYRHSGNLWNIDWYENIVETGIIYGGIVTITGSAGVDTPPNTTEIRVTPGYALYVNHNTTTASKGETVVTPVPFGPFTQSFKDFVTSSQAAYLYVDINGDLKYQTSIFTTDQYHSAFPLGVVFALTTRSIASFGDLRVTNYGQTQQASEFIRAFGPLKVRGYDMTAQSGSLRFSIAAGNTYRFGGFYTQDTDTPSSYASSAIPTASLVRVYQDPAAIGGFRATTNVGGAPFTVVDPTKWDDGSGTLQTVGAGEYTIQRVFQGVVNNVSYIYYGQNKYTSLASAVQSITTENFNESQTSIISLPFIGYVIAEGTATNLADTGSARIINAGLFRNTAGASGGGGASVTNLNDLSDVTITTPSDGQGLIYQSGVWINSNTINSASYAQTASYAASATFTGGQDQFITRWEGTTALTTSSLFQGNNKNIGVNVSSNASFDPTNPESLFVSGSNINVIHAEANVNNYIQLNIVNNSNGAQGSADIVATNNAGTEFGNYVDLGINGSNYGGAIGGNNEAYLYNTGSNFLIGNQTRGVNANLKFFAGNDGTIFPLVVTGSNVIASGAFSGSFDGELGNLTQNLAITGTLFLSGSSSALELHVQGQTQITGSLIVSGTSGYGVFSKGFTITDTARSGLNITSSYFAWRAPYEASVVKLYAIKSGSSNVSINARRSGSGAQHLATNLTVTNNNLWTDGGAVSNTAYTIGDSLEIQISGSSILDLSVQVDFIKR